MFVGNINLPNLPHNGFFMLHFHVGPVTMHLGLRTSSLGLRAPLPARIGSHWLTLVTSLYRFCLANLEKKHVKIQKLPATFVQDA